MITAHAGFALPFARVGLFVFTLRNFGMNIEQRADLLHNCVAQLVAAHEEFVLTKDQEITPKHAFWKAADALVQAFSGEAGDIPQSCWTLFVAIYGNGESEEGGFKRAWSRYKTDQDASQNPTWKPGPAVWSAYRNLCAAMKSATAVRERLVEPIVDLVKQGVSEQQIARMYKKYTVGGSPDIGWVERMKAQYVAADGTAKAEQPIDTRRVHQQKKTQSATAWDQYAAALARSPEIRRVREALEQGLDVEQVGIHSVRREDATQGPQLAFGEPDWQEESHTPWAPVEAAQSFSEPLSEAADIPSDFTIEQQAVMLLDRGVPDEEIKGHLGISGQQLGAWKRRADEIRAGMSETVVA